MLKHFAPVKFWLIDVPAAFGRLCVETLELIPHPDTVRQPPSGGCVLKRAVASVGLCPQEPAAFGRLCVETTPATLCRVCRKTSRLRAAVC